MKPPIAYYGGKQKMARHILPNIPPHNLYCEPFAGGAAIFWNKPVSAVEVLNDTNRLVINFYRQITDNFAQLQQMIEGTLHARASHEDAKVMYDNPHLFTDLQLAWAFFTLNTQGFFGQISDTWGCSNNDSKCPLNTRNKREGFLQHYADRLALVQLENRDALKVIQTRDKDDAFFYIDPPYFNSDCGHYGGYTELDFKALLNLLSTIKGRFLLSSYPSPVLDEFVKSNDWQQLTFNKHLSATSKKGSRKIEVLTSNYPLNLIP